MQQQPPAYDVGGDAWMAQHGALERLVREAHQRDGALAAELAREPPRLRALCADLLVSEVWRERLLPAVVRVLGAAAAGGGGGGGGGDAAPWLRLYICLYHESAAANLLQLLMYHEAVAVAVAEADCLIDVIDYCVRRVTALAAAAHARAALRPSERRQVVAGRLCRLAEAAPPHRDSPAAGCAGERLEQQHQAARAAGAPAGADPELALALALGAHLPLHAVGAWPDEDAGDDDEAAAGGGGGQPPRAAEGAPRPPAGAASSSLVGALERLLRDGGPPHLEGGHGSPGSEEAALAAPPTLATHCARVARWAADARLSGGLACLSVLRFLSEHVAALPLSAAARLLDTHDVMLAMVPLIENPPSVRRCRRPGGAGGGSGTQRLNPPPAPGGSGPPSRSSAAATEAAAAPPATTTSTATAAAAAAKPVWRKFVNNAWVDVPPGELLRLTPHEAAPWLTLYNLACDAGCRSRYALHSHRKGTLLRVRKYLTRTLLDQVPLLAGLQRYLDELALKLVPEPTSAPGGAAGCPSGLLLQAVPQVHEAALRQALEPPRGWRPDGDGGGGLPTAGGGASRVAAAAAAVTTAAAAAATACVAAATEPVDAGGSGRAGHHPGGAAPPLSSAASTTSSALLALEGGAAAGGGGGAGADDWLRRSLELVDRAGDGAHQRVQPSAQLWGGGEEAGGSRAAAVQRRQQDAAGGGRRTWSWEDAARWCARGLQQGTAGAAESAVASFLGPITGAAAPPGGHHRHDAGATAAAASAADERDVFEDEELLSLLAGAPKCERCGAAGPSVKRCARCRNVHYCSRACQAASWTLHAPLCDVVARDRARSAPVAAPAAPAAARSAPPRARAAAVHARVVEA